MRVWSIFPVSVIVIWLLDVNIRWNKKKLRVKSLLPLTDEKSTCYRAVINYVPQRMVKGHRFWCVSVCVSSRNRTPTLLIRQLAMETNSCPRRQHRPASPVLDTQNTNVHIHMQNCNLHGTTKKWKVRRKGEKGKYLWIESSVQIFKLFGSWTIEQEPIRKVGGSVLALFKLLTGPQTCLVPLRSSVDTF